MAVAPERVIWSQIERRCLERIANAERDGSEWRKVLAEDTLRVARARLAGQHDARTTPFAELMRRNGIK